MNKHLSAVPDHESLMRLSKENLQQDLEALDPYAKYFSKDELENQMDDPDHWTGIGAEMFSRDGKILVSPYQDGPLGRAGVTERSILGEINGTKVTGGDLQNIADMLRGPSGSMVTLKLRPLSGEDMVEVRVRREAVRPLHVELLQPQDQAVLRIREFAAGRTRPSLRVTIDYLGAGRRPVFVDLRDASGGDLFEALDCAALFIEAGRSLGGLETRESGRTLINSPPGEKLSREIVVFTGPDTASAAEAFVSALKFHGTAIQVGQSTYGKCSTQTRITLSDGSVLQLTNGRVLGPEGVSCSPEGLEPDISVAGSRLYDTAYLVRKALTLLSTQDAPPETRQEYTLQQVADEGRLTVRALRAWDRLSDGYAALVLDLLQYDLDLLRADAAQVQTWAEMAEKSEDPGFARHAQDLNSLGEYMERNLWNDLKHN